MTSPIIFHPDARLEYDDAGDWYEQRQPGLGVRLTDAVDHRITIIAADPRRYAVVWRDVREVDVPGFPYCVYYVAGPAHVWVLAVFHTSRNPRIWKRRRNAP